MSADTLSTPEAYYSASPAQRAAAKVAGWSCLLTMALVVFANYGIYNRLIVSGNVAETARNIVTHETLFRTVVVCFLIYCIGSIVQLAAFYVILKPVNHGLALTGAVFRFVFALTWVVVALNLLGALRLASGPTYLQVFEPDRLQAWARLSLSGNFDAYYLGLPFLGLASTLCSYLWLKSNYIPKALAFFGLIASAWCVVCAFAFLIFPNFRKTVNWYWFDSPLGGFELILSFWLLFKNLRQPDPV